MNPMMRFALERTVDPEIEPVSAAEFIRNVGEFAEAATERADDITRVIQSAREWVEHDTARALIDQTWRLTITDGTEAGDRVSQPGYYCGWWRSRQGEILLRRSPALAIVSFVSVDDEGDETAVDASSYELREADTKFPKIVGLNGTTWDTGTFRITFRAGYANRDVSPAEGASVVPARFRQAILLHAEAHYDHDKDMDAMVAAAEALIAPERCGLDFA
jgi:uncharacterized phiE125 gp8 family phage protein